MPLSSEYKGIHGSDWGPFRWCKPSSLRLSFCTCTFCYLRVNILEHYHDFIAQSCLNVNWYVTLCSEVLFSLLYPFSFSCHSETLHVLLFSFPSHCHVQPSDFLMTSSCITHEYDAHIINLNARCRQLFECYLSIRCCRSEFISSHLLKFLHVFLSSTTLAPM